jgi:hypothetical protein
MHYIEFCASRCHSGSYEYHAAAFSIIASAAVADNAGSMSFAEYAG